MTIEKNIFQKQRPNHSKLLSFGFHKENGHYIWRQQFFADQFLAQLDIDQTGKVTGQLIDLNSGDEYLPLRASHLGPYASQVKTAYEQLLETIAHDCFIAMPFHSSQANRLASAIKQ